MSLPTAIELAANAPEREPSDQELLAGYQPSFPHPIDLNSEVAYGGEMLRYKDAVAKERAAFIARKRKAIQDKREREERARIAKIEAAEKQQAFEAASKRGEARAALKDALAAYQQLLEQTHTLESTLIEARAHEAFLRTDAADPGNDKFGRTLGAARDATLACEVRAERAAPLLQQAAQTLCEAITLARAEFSFLFFEERKKRLERASDQLSALFDSGAFRHLRITLQHLAGATCEVAGFDRATNYQGYHQLWIDLRRQQMQADGQLLQNVSPSAERLIQAATEVEDRFIALDQIISS
jgi:hypothetical protein